MVWFNIILNILYLYFYIFVEILKIIFKMQPVNNNLYNQQNQQQHPMHPLNPIQPIHPQNFYNYANMQPFNQFYMAPNMAPNAPNNVINDNINDNINNMNNMQNMQNQLGNPMFMNPMQQQLMMQQQQQQQQQFMIQQAVQQVVQQLPIIQQQDLRNPAHKQSIKKIESDESSEEEPVKQKSIKRTKPIITKGNGKRKGISLDDVMEQDLGNPARKRDEQDLGNPARKLDKEISIDKGARGAEALVGNPARKLDEEISIDKGARGAEALVGNPPRKQQEKISKNNGEEVDNKMSGEIDVFLANIFDKSLDSIKFKEPQDKTFISKKNNSNVIKSISPKNPDKAHFNKDTHPDEVYNVKFIGYEDEKYEIKASDINAYSLETHKYIYEYNKTFVYKIHNKELGFIYARSSSDNTVSIETQRQVCFKFTRENNIKLCDFGFQFDNNISARNMNNIKHELGFWKDYIEDGSHIIIYSVDRLSRHLINGMKYLDEMVARGITFHFVTNELKYGTDSSATQKGMIQTLLIEAEKFSNMTSEKVKTTRKRLIAEGNELGPAKYGFKVVLVNGIRKKLLCQEEQENIRKIKEKYQDVSDNFEDYQRAGNVQRSFLSIYRFIERWCVRSGIKYRKGQPFTDLKIREIVKSK